MSRIFVSYRRDDAAGYAGRLFDRLSEVFGRDSVFMDVDTIGGGVDFVETIENAVGSCDVFVALIGNRWLAADQSGARRLDNNEDFVRLEVGSALARGIRFIPVLVDGAAMPAADDLPEVLRSLARRNAVELSNTRWDQDVARLIGSIQEAGVEARPAPWWQRRVGPLPVWLLATVLALGAGGPAAWWGLRSLTGAQPAVSTQSRAVFVPEEVVIRPSLAVLDLDNISGDPETAWLGTAIGEALGTTLGAGDEVRIIPGSEVARAVQELPGLSAEQPDADALKSLRTRLGVDTVVSGSYSILDKGVSALLRLDLRLWDALTGELSSSEGVTGTPEQLFDLVERAGGAMREELALDDLTPAQVLAVRATLPAGVQAARLYAEGLMKRRQFDDQAARRLLESAVETDPEHALSHSELARVLWALGYEDQAQVAAGRAVELAKNLPIADKLAIQAFHHETLGEWGEAVQIYETLYQAHPDDIDLGIKLVLAQSAGERLDDSLGQIAILEKLPPPASLDPRLDIAEARVYQQMGDYEAMMAAARQATEGGRAAQMDALVAESLMIEAIGLQDGGDIDRASAALDEASALFQAAGDRHGVARAIELKGHNAAFLGRLDSAGRLWERALDSYRELGNRYGQGRILGSLAIIRVQEGRLEEAESLNQQAMALYRELGLKYEEAAAHNQFGMALQAGGELDRAREQYTASLKLLSELGSRGFQAIALTNLAELSFLQGDLEEARQLHQESLAIREEIGDRYGIAYDTYRLGLVLAARGDLNVARTTLDRALEIQEEVEDSLGAADTRLALAELEIADDRPEEGEKLARLAEEVARTSGANDQAARAQTVLGACLLAQGKLAEARAAAQSAGQRVAVSEDSALRLASLILDARVAAASGDSAAAVTTLSHAAVDAEQAGYRGFWFEAKLALGEVFLASGDTYRARSELIRVEAAASQAGFGRVERQAAALLAST